MSITVDGVPVEKLVRTYLKMKVKKDELAAQEKTLDSQIVMVKSALLAFCKENNMESVRTTEGLFYRSVKKRFTTNDWESMGKFVLEHRAPDLYEKRLHQGNIQTFLEEHPDLLPPGLNVDSEYTITVRRD